VVLVANKCEGRLGATGVIDAFALGFGDPVAISAEHGEGLADLYDAIAPHAAAAAAARRRPRTADGLQPPSADRTSASRR
jgi:GTP-binding protein